MSEQKTLYDDVSYFTHDLDNHYHVTDHETIYAPSWVFTPEIREKIVMQLLDAHKDKELVKQVLSGRTTFTQALQPLEERAKYLVDEFDSSGKIVRIFDKEELFGHESVKQTLESFTGILDIQEDYSSRRMWAKPYADFMSKALLGISYDPPDQSSGSDVSTQIVKTLVLRNCLPPTILSAAYCATHNTLGSTNGPLSSVGQIVWGGLLGFTAAVFSNYFAYFLLLPNTAPEVLLEPLKSIKCETKTLDDHFQKYYLR